MQENLSIRIFQFIVRVYQIYYRNSNVFLTYLYVSNSPLLLEILLEILT